MIIWELSFRKCSLSCESAYFRSPPVWSVCTHSFLWSIRALKRAVSQFSTVCLADDKTLHSDTGVQTVDTAHRPRKLLFTVQSYQTCLGVLGKLRSLLPHFTPTNTSIRAWTIVSLLITCFPNVINLCTTFITLVFMYYHRLFPNHSLRGYIHHVLCTGEHDSVMQNICWLEVWFWHILNAFLSSQERISQLEEDLNEEHCSGDRLMERLDKTKVQAGFLPRYLCFCFFLRESLILCLLAFLNVPSCEEIELCPVLSLNTQPYVCFDHKQI